KTKTKRKEWDPHMKKAKLFFMMFIVFTLLFLVPLSTLSKEKEKDKDKFEVPSHVLTISKENTYPNSTEDQEVVEPSKLTKELIEDVDVPIENPELIKMLNETS